jgi:hypothetical protein
VETERDPEATPEGDQEADAEEVESHPIDEDRELPKDEPVGEEGEE